MIKLEGSKNIKVKGQKFKKGTKLMFSKTRIREFDIKKANINIFLKLGLIDKETYDKLDNMEKKDRVTAIGVMTRDRKDLYDALIAEEDKVTAEFIKVNNIDSIYVDEINYDAIWITGSIPIKELTIRGLEMVCKNDFTSYIIIGKIKIYYNSVTDEVLFRYAPKEMKENEKFVSFIKEVMFNLESNNKKDCYIKTHEYLDTLTDQMMIKRYVHWVLDVIDI